MSVLSESAEAFAVVGDDVAQASIGCAAHSHGHPLPRDVGSGNFHDFQESKQQFPIGRSLTIAPEN